MKKLSSEFISFLEHSDFHQLSPAQQAEVLQQMSEAEYRQLYQVYHQASSYSREETAELTAPPNIKTRLMERFQEKHPPRIPVYQRGIPAWQVAALVIVLLVPIFILRPAPVTEIQYVAQKDTILQQIPVVEKVMVDCPDQPVPAQAFNVIRKPHVVKRTQPRHTRLPASPDINIQSLEVLKSPNTQPGTSMAEDKLIRQFPAVSL